MNRPRSASRLMLRSTSIAVFSSAALLLVGCAGTDGGGGAGGSETTTLTFGTVVEVGHPAHRCASEPFAEYINEETDGRITVDIFPAGQLGTEAELIDQVIAGDLDVTIATPGHLAEYFAPLSVLSAAYLFDDYESMLEVSRGDVGSELWAGLEEASGAVVLDMFPMGVRVVTTSDGPVHTPDDLKGIAMRAPDAPIWVANVEALGATPTPMALGEIYTALQQGVIDSQENPVTLIDSNSFYEVQEYVSLTNHVVQGNPLIINGDVWAELSTEDREVLRDAAGVAAEQLTGCLEDELDEILTTWTDNGSIEVNRDVDVDAFREHATPILLERFGDEWDGYYERIQQAQGN